MCHVRIGGLWGSGGPPASVLTERRRRHRLQVRVGHQELVGEVIRIEGDKATIQVYEETCE